MHLPKSPKGRQTLMRYTAFEYILYNSLRSGAIIALAFGILRKKSRFSQELTAVLFVLMTGVWVASSAIGLYFLHRYNIGATIEVLQSIMLLVFMCIAIKDNIGKLMFIFFMLYTVGGLVSIAGKFIEIQIWPVQAYYAYYWTATIGLLLAILLILVPFGLAIYYDACAIMGKEGESAVWRYCWLIPATFYLFWLQGMYGKDETALEVSSKLSNILYMLAINASAYLIYHMVMRMIIDHNHLLQARAENQALTVQVTQFKDLRERIEDARRTRHDLRHHVAVLQNIAESGDKEALLKYIDEFRKGHRLDEPIVYCENATASTVLSYFAHMAADENIVCDFRFNMPAEVGIDKSDLAVMLGNLLENAVQACKRQTFGARRIKLRGGLQEGGMIAFIIDNTTDVEPKLGETGLLRSTKHEGYGIGTDSVRSIAERYGGMVEYNYEPGMFHASVMLYATEVEKQDV